MLKIEVSQNGTKIDYDQEPGSGPLNDMAMALASFLKGCSAFRDPEEILESIYDKALTIIYSNEIDLVDAEVSI